jgi:hypothetical protein
MLPTTAVPTHVTERIVQVRGTRVIMDSDLASLYGVRTKALLQAVRRNEERFPRDFLITLTNHELASLRSQIVTSNARGRGGRRYSIKAFTEHGAVMAATVLNSPRAIAVSILIVRTFVSMREAVALHADVARRLDELEKKLEAKLVAQDQTIVDILAALRALMAAPEPRPARGIGFVR